MDFRHCWTFTCMLIIFKAIQSGKNDLRFIKRILYDMGPLTLVRWLLQRDLKFEPPSGSRSKLKRVPPPMFFVVVFS